LINTSQSEKEKTINNTSQFWLFDMVGLWEKQKGQVFILDTLHSMSIKIQTIFSRCKKKIHSKGSLKDCALRVKFSCAIYHDILRGNEHKEAFKGKSECNWFSRRMTKKRKKLKK
jgi:hypothetical protein